jgi:predicted RNA-binding protein YlxR (DUF448 family)
MAEQQKPVRKIPLRECLGCSERLPKASLLRVVRSPEGEVSLDFTGKKSGRGAYICRQLRCLQKARKSKRMERSLEVAIPDAVYDAMEQELAEHEHDA